MALLVDLVFQCLAVDGQLSVLNDELFHDVTVVNVYGKDLRKAYEYVVLAAVLRVDERSQLLGKVDCLIDGDLGRFLLVLLEKERKGLDDQYPGGVAIMKLCAVFKHIIVFNELREEVVQGLDCASTEDFVKNSDL